MCFDGTTVTLIRGVLHRITCITPLPRAPVCAGVLGQVKKNRIGSCVEAPCIEPSFCRGTRAGKEE